MGPCGACLRKPLFWGLFQADFPLASSTQTASSETLGGRTGLVLFVIVLLSEAAGRARAFDGECHSLRAEVPGSCVCCGTAIRRKKQEENCQLLATWSHNCRSQPGHFSIQPAPGLASDISVENDIRESPTTCLTTNKFAQEMPGKPERQEKSQERELMFKRLLLFVK